MSEVKETSPPYVTVNPLSSRPFTDRQSFAKTEKYTLDIDKTISGIAFY